MFAKFMHWLVTSSENPSQVALTVKGFIIWATPGVLTALGFFHIAIGGGDLTNFGNEIVVLIQSALTTIGAAIAAYGFIRKIFNSFVPWPTDPEVVGVVGQPKQ